MTEREKFEAAMFIMARMHHAIVNNTGVSINAQELELIWKNPYFFASSICDIKES